MSGHESPIKTPKQLIIVVVLAFLIPIMIIVLLTRFVDQQTRPGAGSNQFTPEATAARIKPIGVVSTEAPVAVAAAAGGAAVVRTGAEVYAAKCAGCHAAGVLGSPKFGDKAAWSGRIGQGYPALLKSALKGKGSMGAQAGGGYSDEEIGAAVKHMANAGGASFK